MAAKRRALLLLLTCVPLVLAQLDLASAHGAQPGQGSTAEQTSHPSASSATSKKYNHTSRSPIPNAGSSDFRGSSTAPAAGLHIQGLPVGQGDSTIIVCPEFDGKVIVFDMGSTQPGWTPGQVESYLRTRTTNGRRPLMDRISTIVVSHPHTDHYSYIPTVFRHLVTRTSRHRSTHSGLAVYLGGNVSKSSYAFYGMQSWLRNVDGTVMLFNRGRPCFLSTCHVGNTWTSKMCGPNSRADIHVLAANTGPEPNEKSVIMRITYGGQSALLVGDFEGDAQSTLLSSVSRIVPGLLRSDVYKVSHHGASFMANAKPFLQAVRPKIAFVSSAYPSVSQYGHPRCSAIQRLVDTQTLLPSPPHPVHCTRGKKGSYVVNKQTLHQSIYSTAPTPRKICVIHVLLNGARGAAPRLQSRCYPFSEAQFHKNTLANKKAFLKLKHLQRKPVVYPTSKSVPRRKVKVHVRGRLSKKHKRPGTVYSSPGRRPFPHRLG